MQSQYHNAKKRNNAAVVQNQNRSSYYLPLRQILPLLSIGLIFAAVHTRADIVVTPTTNQAALATAISPPGSGLTNVTVTLSAQTTTNGAFSVGVYSITVSPDTYGLTTNGIILSTGDVADFVTGSNFFTNNTTAYGVAATTNQDNLLSPITGTTTNFDVTQVDVHFDVLPGVSNLNFQVVFGSDEFPESVRPDGLGIYLNGTNIALISSSVINAFHPGMTAIAGTELDGVIGSGSNAVNLITVPVVPGSTNNSLTVIIGDSGDANVDSTAYLALGAPAAVTNLDLAIVKSASPDPVELGAILTYTVSVTNLGANTATGVTVTDTLPAEVSFLAVTNSQGTCAQSNGVVNCALGTLTNLASATLSIMVTTAQQGLVTNTAVVSSQQTDTNLTNNTATVVVTVNPAATNADLSITKTDAPDPVGVGSNLTYTVVITNGGAADATGVMLVDTLPATVNFVSATPTQGSCSNSGGTVNCNLGAITNGAEATVTIVVTPQLAGSITNLAVVAGDQGDSNSTNNSATAITTVNAAAGSTDLAVSKTDSPDPVNVGSNLTYVVVVTNLGPNTATGITVTDALPTSVSFVSAGTSQGSCTETNQVVTCDLGSLASSATATLSFVVSADLAGSVTNSVTVTGNESDPNLTNNVATAVTTVLGPTADLGVTKSANPTMHMTNCVLVYTVSVTNAGPDTATGVVLTDTLPDTTLFVIANPTQGNCSQDTGVVTCNFGALTNEGSAQVSIMVVTGSALSLTNIATVTSNVSDDNQANNTAILVTRTAAEGAVTAAFDKVSSKCKDKRGVETCKLKASLELQNTGGADVSDVHIRFFLSDNETFEEDTDTFLGDDTSKTLKPGKSKGLKVKQELLTNPSGMFILAVDDNDNVLAAQLVP